MNKTVTPDLMFLAQDKLKGLIEEKPWMKQRKFLLASSVDEVKDFIDKAIQTGRCVIDLETTGLNTRMKKIKKQDKTILVPATKLVGVGLCYDHTFAMYVPLGHQIDEELNLPEESILEELRRLCTSAVTIYHNAKFDMAQLNNRGIYVDGYTKFEDTQILARLYDSNQKDIKLKNLSERHLNQPMLKFTDMVAGSERFDLISPRDGYVYGASDAICTFDLFNFFTASKIVQNQKGIYNIEKKVVFVVMEMESNLVKVDSSYLQKQKESAEKRLKELTQEIYTLAGQEFNIGSTVQLGKILTGEKFKFNLPKTEKGSVSTDNAALKALAATQPICKKLIAFRGLEKSLGTYINNLLNNRDEDDCIKFGFHQSGTDTGRFSSPGGQGLEEDGYSGVNVQSIPKATKDGDSGEELPDIRKCVISRPGKTIIAADYENEEMRVAANLSNETTWINAVNNGIDFHTATGALISGKSTNDVTPEDRRLGKSTNFLALYMGGARTLASNAGISEAEAKRVLATFYAGVPRLKSWMEKEIKASRKSKMVRTKLGRIRPLAKFYDTEDRGLQNHGDRCVTNTQIQGCLQGHERCLTTEGYLPISEIKDLKSQGKDLKVWTGYSWETFEVIDRGESQLAEIELRNGLKIDVDVRHEVLVEEPDGYKYKRFDELKETTRICTSEPTEKEFGHYPDPFIYDGQSNNAKNINIDSHDQWNDIAYLLGCLVGDGSVSVISDIDHYITSLCFGKSKVDKLFLNIKRIINSLGLNLNDPRLNKNSNGVSFTIPIYSKGLIFLLRYMGYNFTNSQNKRVPERIFRSPLSMRKAFLRGYFDTDGAKSRANRYSFHTPNEQLLKDVQLLALTLGCASAIHKDNTGAFLLLWQDLRSFEKAVGLEITSVKRRNNSSLFTLPDFMRERLLMILKDVKSVDKNNNAYINKIKKGKRVSIPGIIQLFKDLGCQMPEVYYAYELKEKRILPETARTYTLSVNSPMHRYDSGGIISKNCCADIMKAVMAKMHSWIHRNNLQDDIKLLITMHDELVMEVTTEKLQLLVPEITKIMMLPEIITDLLKWPIPLTVDVKYGESWRVKKKFYEDFPELKDRIKEPLLEFSSFPNMKSEESSNNIENSSQESKKLMEKDKELFKNVPEDSEKKKETIQESFKNVPEDSEKKNGTIQESFKKDNEKGKETIQELSKSVPEYNEKSKEIIQEPLKDVSENSERDLIETQKISGSVTESKIELSPDVDIVSDSKDLSEIKSEISDNELIYTLRDTNDMTLLHLNSILKFILQEEKKKDDRYSSQKKILRIRDREGNSVLISEYKVPIDLFLGLSRFFRL